VGCRAPCLAVVLLLGLAMPAVAIDDGAARERLVAVLAAAPADVKAFVMRARGCGHWAGEEPYNKERAADINKALTELKCDQLDAAEVALRRKYAGSLAAQQALDVRNSDVAP
jgi:hypothetical protein